MTTGAVGCSSRPGSWRRRALFAALGALASQMAPTRRVGAGARGRRPGRRPVPADRRRHRPRASAGCAGRRRSAGIEQLRPVTGARPAVLAPLRRRDGGARRRVALAVARGRDVDSSLLRPRAVALADGAARLAHAGRRCARSCRSSWLARRRRAASPSPSARSRTASRTEIRKVSIHTYGLPITTATGYLATVFALFALIVALYAASHIGGLRDEESSGRLETLFALPVARRVWIGGRLASPRATTVASRSRLGVLAWAGAAVTSGDVGLRRHARGRRELHRRLAALPGARRAPLRLGAAAQPGRGVRAGRRSRSCGSSWARS